ncbi:hypothetical protein QHI69_06655 [Burkholderia gladioli pv. gladioli]|uniref:Uncharacterized protein n=2 Tax=Burkholderia gladioli TaxID=28095 RepID=A0AAW3F532_BURGA|nr:hypothetical protein [Burkholderia gladioli]AJW97100.1 hypothetical protein BM43_1365 [Burkholderia gladioli]KGC16279.1 hypothetical protein DM48_4279 [Burkholderia gladioli]MDJ1161587.1 hypothetical protein [Burkholderia gladioli pv. gladioli]SQA89454.1 Uncharacterised protein [Burkholderia gladioli]
MNTHQYHLVDAQARNMINLREHASEITRAFRYVPFRHGGLKIHPDCFEFTTPDPLTRTDSRLMGKAIAASATTLAAMAVKVYEAARDSKSRTSTQLFKRR